MERTVLNGIELAYEFATEAGAQAPVVVFSNSLGTSAAMWAPQVAALRAHMRVLTYDMRGHGASSAPAGPYSMEQLASDLIGLMDHLGIGRAYYCGLSMSGQLGLWLARHRPERFERLVLANTAAKIGNDALWNDRIATVQSAGMAALTDAIIERWFTAAFRASHPEVVAPVRSQLLATAAAGYAGACGAIRDTDLRGSAPEIGRPVLVIAGRHDPATTAAEGRWLAAAIPQAAYLELDTAHLSNLEAPEAFTRALTGFFSAGPLHETARHAAGMAVRRAVLSDAYVDRAQARTSSFTAEFQDLITRYAWGEIWTRPGLPRHTRSLLTLGMTLAANRMDEFRLHVRAAANNGVSPDEIKEVLLQAAIYCGVPAANAAFHVAQEELAQALPSGPVASSNQETKK